MKTKTLLYCPLCSFFKIYKMRFIVLSLLTITFMSFKMIYHPDPPDANHTGSPYDGNDCTNCHGDYTVNTGAGVVSVTSDIPGTGYIAGTTYNITANISYSGRPRFQFSLSPHSAIGTPLGTLVANAQTDIQVSGPQYISGKFFTIDNANGQSWTFPWIAPVATTGPVTFYAVLMASNGGDDTGDDYVYTTSLSVTEGISVTPLSCSITGSTNPTCNGACTGTATVTGADGTTPFTYAWSNGQITQTATGLCAGTYMVTVTDNSLDTCVSSVTITEPALLVASVSSQTNVSCDGGTDGSATVSASGGTPGYSYSWNTTPVQNTSNATGLMAGTYTATIMDANNCSKTATVTIIEPLAITLNLSQTPDSGATDGTASVVASGGTGPYSYVWINGDTTSTADSLSAGSVSVTVTDANGCTKNGSITVILYGSLYGIISTTPVSCFGVCDGSASIVISGGTTPYSILWNNSSINDTITGLCATEYTVIINDNDSNVFYDTVNIAGPAQLDAFATSTAILCNGDSATVTVSATGGTSPYTGTGNFKHPAGTFFHIVTDINGCTSDTASITLTEPSALSGTLSSTTSNGSGSGTATVVVTGGTSPYNYLWSNNSQDSVTATGLNPGTVSITVTDANNCTFSGTVDIVLGIAFNEFVSSFKAFPNPNNGDFSIEINSSLNENYLMTVIDMKGQMVYQEQISNSNGKTVFPVSLGRERKGIYIIQILSNEDVVHFPITLIR